MTCYPRRIVSDDQEHTQRTDKGLEIPVPDRKSFFGNLRKVLKPSPDSLRDARRPEEDQPEHR